MGNKGKGGVGMFYNKKHRSWSVTVGGVSQIVGLSSQASAEMMMKQMASNLNRRNQLEKAGKLGRIDE